jgi:hypothetical protein
MLSVFCVLLLCVFVVCCLLFVVCCFVVAAWWLPFGGCRLVVAVWWLLFGVCCLLATVYTSGLLFASSPAADGMLLKDLFKPPHLKRTLDGPIQTQRV